MRLDFNVLWVDDQPTAVTSQIENIRSRMAEEGFKLIAKQCRSIDDVEKLITGNVFQDEVDLILVDWDLGGGVQGQDAIERIREVAQYKDVIFYSANPAEDLRRKVFDKKLEGIFCTSRVELVDEVIGVFESLIKKVLDLDHTRGIVMGATSDIESMIRAGVCRIGEGLGGTAKGELIKEAKKRVTERVADVSKKGTQLAAANSVETILNEHSLFQANDCLRLLIWQLKNDPNRAESVEAIKTYMQEVVPKRNSLSHMVLTPEGQPNAIVNTDGRQINLNDMRALRISILNYREKFRALLGTLNA